jgi:hypothetical protein
MSESSDTLGPVIAAAIGLPTSNLISFTLRFTAQQPVRCDAEYLVPSESGSAISQIIGKSYDLQQR